MAIETIILLAVTTTLLLIGKATGHRRLFITTLVLTLPFYASGLFMQDKQPLYQMAISILVIAMLVNLSRRRVGEPQPYWHPSILAALELMTLAATLTHALTKPPSTFALDLVTLIIYAIQLLIICRLAAQAIKQTDWKTLNIRKQFFAPTLFLISDPAPKKNDP